jgi:hypothetical protein
MLHYACRSKVTAAWYHLEAQKVILQLKAENSKTQNSAILDDGYVGDGEKQAQVELATRGATDMTFGA